MSGHTHAQTIRRKKDALDKKRGKLFSKFAKLIIVAAARGGGDPDQNLSLRYAIDKAKAANMPRDTIERAIKKGTGELDGGDLAEQTFEGVGPGGVHILVECLTDNRHRTAPEMRNIFEKLGGKLGGPGSTAWMFDKKGVLLVPQAQTDEESLMMLALDQGAEDIKAVDELFEVTTSPERFADVKQALEAEGLTFESAEISYVPKNSVRIDDPDVAQRLVKLLDALDDHDDVQSLASNEELPEAPASA